MFSTRKGTKAPSNFGIHCFKPLSESIRPDEFSQTLQRQKELRQKSMRQSYAAIKIQKLFRSFQLRKKFKQQCNNLLLDFIRYDKGNIDAKTLLYVLKLFNISETYREWRLKYYKNFYNKNVNSYAYFNNSILSHKTPNSKDNLVSAYYDLDYILKNKILSISNLNVALYCLSLLQSTYFVDSKNDIFFFQSILPIAQFFSILWEHLLSCTYQNKKLPTEFILKLLTATPIFLQYTSHNVFKLLCNSNCVRSLIWLYDSNFVEQKHIADFIKNIFSIHSSSDVWKFRLLARLLCSSFIQTNINLLLLDILNNHLLENRSDFISRYLLILENFRIFHIPLEELLSWSDYDLLQLAYDFLDNFMKTQNRIIGNQEKNLELTFPNRIYVINLAEKLLNFCFTKDLKLTPNFIESTINVCEYIINQPNTKYNESYQRKFKEELKQLYHLLLNPEMLEMKKILDYSDVQIPVLCRLYFPVKHYAEKPWIHSLLLDDKLHDENSDTHVFLTELSCINNSIHTDIVPVALFNDKHLKAFPDVGILLQFLNKKILKNMQDKIPQEHLNGDHIQFLLEPNFLPSTDYELFTILQDILALIHLLDIKLNAMAIDVKNRETKKFNLKSLNLFAIDSLDDECLVVLILNITKYLLRNLKVLPSGSYLNVDILIKFIKHFFARLRNILINYPKMLDSENHYLFEKLFNSSEEVMYFIKVLRGPNAFLISKNNALSQVFDTKTNSYKTLSLLIHFLPQSIELSHRFMLFDLMLTTYDRLSNKTTQVFIDRENLIDSILNESLDWHSRFAVSFKSSFAKVEPGVDAGGPFREFMDLLSCALFDPKYKLFKMLSNNTCIPNPNAFAIHGHNKAIKLFKLTGVIIGKAIQEGLVLQPVLNRCCYNLLLSRKNTISELAYLDLELYNNLNKLKNQGCNLDDLNLVFSITVQTPSKIEEVDLIPNGSSISVTKENLNEYIDKMSDYYTNQQFAKEIQYIKSGLAYFNYDGFTIFESWELSELISGSRMTIDIEDLFKNMIYGPGYEVNSQTICDLKDILINFSYELKQKFLCFVTGNSRPPFLGFSMLEPPFKIVCQGCEHLLPSAATCNNQLNLPDYKNYDALKSKLLISIEHCTGFFLI